MKCEAWRKKDGTETVFAPVGHESLPKDDFSFALLHTIDADDWESAVAAHAKAMRLVWRSA